MGEYRLRAITDVENKHTVEIEFCFDDLREMVDFLRKPPVDFVWFVKLLEKGFKECVKQDEYST